MLKAYTFVATDHQHLHDFVMEFFSRIEFETGPFSLNFFNIKFQEVVKRHRDILLVAFSDIYEDLNDFQDQADKSRICKEIKESNQIDNICAGLATPKRIDHTDEGIYKKLRTLFLKLYSNVLDGTIVHEELHTTLRQHFEQFRKANNDITLCPMCGISELKTEHDDVREQYDHYLPESLYPLSSVNFHNLVPTCKECNSLDVKADSDIILFRQNRLFYPYDTTNTGIDIHFLIQNDSENIEDIEWQLRCRSRDGKEDEVKAWMQIYKIESRYLSFVKGRIEKWYKTFWGYLRNPSIQSIPYEQRTTAYFAVLTADEVECLSIIRNPALSAFLNGSPLARAAQEAKLYS